MKLRVDPKSHLRITIGTALAMGMIGGYIAQQVGLGWGAIAILAGCIATWNAYRVWWSTWEPRFQNAVMRAQMAQRDAIDLLADEIGEREAMMRAAAKATARSIDQDMVDGDPDAMEFLQRKMTPYEAGVDGPLCTNCHHRWCKGDCEK